MVSIIQTRYCFMRIRKTVGLAGNETVYSCLRFDKGSEGCPTKNVKAYAQCRLIGIMGRKSLALID